MYEQGARVSKKFKHTATHVRIALDGYPNTIGQFTMEEWLLNKDEEDIVENVDFKTIEYFVHQELTNDSI